MTNEADQPSGSMAPIIGRVPFFDNTEKLWKIFEVQLEQFLVANDISKEAKKKAILVTSLSENAYMLLQNLLSPLQIEAENVTFTLCMQAMRTHFKTATSGFAERCKFYNATKSASESINEWAVRVRSLAANCEFGTHLNTAIRDKFVMGLEKGPAKDKIFLENVTTPFEKVLEIANNAEYILQQYHRCDVKQDAELNFVKRQSSAWPKSREEMGMSKNQKYGSEKKSPKQQQQCNVCGYNNHCSTACKFRNYKCNLCKQRGHLKKMCKTKRINFIQNDEISLFSMRSICDGPIKVNIYIKDKSFSMELDTGSEYNVISENTYYSFFSEYVLKPVKVLLKSYNGEKIQPIGKCEVDVKYNEMQKQLSMLVIKNGGPPLLGRDFLNKFEIQLAKLNYSSHVECEKEKIFKKFSDLFDGSLGLFKNGKASLNIKEGTQPRFFRPRPVPLAIKEKVEKEIDMLVSLKVLEGVKYSEWGTPIVPIIKKNGGIRICGDFKVTVNPSLNVDKYPLPRIEELFAKLHGGEEFSKLDLSMAYQQIELNDESKKFTTISTSKGLFQYTRLIYGLASAPAIFQRIMDSLLAGLDGVVVFLDDVLITAPNREQHVQRLSKVLNILRDSGFKLSRDKCDFFCDKIHYLGHVIDRNGLHMNHEKVIDIQQIKYPKNVKELQSFLGMVNFYRRFIPGIATLLSPLYELLRADSKFVWDHSCSKSMDELKNILMSENCLAHYNPDERLKLIVDASPVGVGAILMQIDAKNVDKPIEFASRTLSQAEKNYSQLDREAVAIYFGVKKFHQYLYGRHFILVTDNKPLQHILSPKKGIPQMASNRLQRIALFLSGYSFDVVHVKSGANVADYFSRFPREHEDKSEQMTRININFLQQLPDGRKFLDFDEIKNETRADETLQEVIRMTLEGWPERCPDDKFKPFFLKKTEFSVEDGCLFWGYRIVIPTALIPKMLNFLHSTHMGVVKMKSMARECCWWPQQGTHLEDVVRECEACLMTRSDPPRQELLTWERPKDVWSRLHIDFFGPFKNRWCLVVVDSSSKWVECIDMAKNTTSKAVIQVLREIFARYGLPRCIVSDNGTSLVSKEFEDFLSSNKIEHKTTPVGNPSTNGQAENMVKTIKTALKRNLQKIAEHEFNNALNRFLLDYRNTIHSSTGVSPAFLMFNGRHLRTRLDLINPHRQVKFKAEENVNKFVKKQQQNQRKYFKGSKSTSFEINSPVIVKDYSIPGKISWKKATVKKILGKQTYLVATPENHCWKRHANQMIKCNLFSEIPSTILDPLQKISNQNETIENNSKINIQENQCYTHRYNLRHRNKK